MTMLPDIDQEGYDAWSADRARQQMQDDIDIFGARQLMQQQISAIVPSPLSSDALTNPLGTGNALPQTEAQPALEPPPSQPDVQPEPAAPQFLDIPSAPPPATPSTPAAAPTGPAGPPSRFNPRPAGTPPAVAAQPTAPNQDWMRDAFISGLNAVEQTGGDAATFAQNFNEARPGASVEQVIGSAFDAASKSGANLADFSTIFKVSPPPPSQPHSEEPGTATDRILAPDLGSRWKTSFDFGSTYTGDYRTGTPHRGIDIVPSDGKGIGTEVDAFAPGTVSLIQRDPGAGGLMVYVRDDDGLTHAYMHLAGTQPGLKVGQRVDRGTPIAQMGESGTEGSPHLHYEVRQNAAVGDPLDKLIDPRPYMSGALQPGKQTGPRPDRMSGGARALPAGLQPSTAAISGGGELAGQIGQQGQAIMSGAADAASWLGEQGQKTLQAILVTEGGLAGARGDNGQSAGPLQFYEGGQLANFAKAMGLSLDAAKTYVEQHPLEAIQWAIGTATRPGYLGTAIANGIGQGLSGAALATFAQRTGQVSDSPERAGANFNTLFGQGQDLVGGSAVLPDQPTPTMSDLQNLVTSFPSRAAQAAEDILGKAGGAASRLGQTAQDILGPIGRGLDDSLGISARQAEIEANRPRGEDSLTSGDVATQAGNLAMLSAASNRMNATSAIEGDYAAGQQLASVVVDKAKGAGWDPSPEDEATVRRALGVITPFNALITAATGGSGGAARALIQGAGILGAQALGTYGAETAARRLGLPEELVPYAGFGGSLVAPVAGSVAARAAPSLAGKVLNARLADKALEAIDRLSPPSEAFASTRRWHESAADYAARLRSEGNLPTPVSGRGMLESSLYRLEKYPPETAERIANWAASTDAPASEIAAVLDQWMVENPVASVPSHMAADVGEQVANELNVKVGRGALRGGGPMPVGPQKGQLGLFDEEPVPYGTRPRGSENLPSGPQRGQLGLSADEYPVPYGMEQPNLPAGEGEGLDPSRLVSTPEERAAMRAEAQAEVERRIAEERARLERQVAGSREAQANLLPGERIPEGAVPEQPGLGLGEATQPQLPSGTEGWEDIPGYQRTTPWGTRAQRIENARALGRSAAEERAAAAGTSRQVGYDPLMEVLSEGPQPTLGGMEGDAAIRTSARDRAVNYMSSNMLIGPHSAIVNAATQTEQTLRSPLIHLFAGYPKEAATGFRLMTQSIADGLGDMVNVWLKGRVPPRVAGQTPRAPVGLEALGVRANVGIDAAFRHAGGVAEAGMEGERLMAQNPGRSWAEVAAENRAALQNAYSKGGANAVFSEEGPRSGFGQQIAKWKHDWINSDNPGKQFAGWALYFAVPFSSIPETIWNVGIRRSPLVNELFGAKKVASALNKGDMRGARLAAAETVMDSAINAAIFGQAMEGNITGGGDPEHPWSIRLPGNNYVDYRGLGPVAMRMGLIASAVEAANDEKKKPTPDMLNAFKEGLNKTASMAEKEWFLDSMGELISRTRRGDFTGAAGNFALRGGDRLVPLGGLANYIEQSTDPVMRDPSTTSVEGLWERQISRVPGLAQTLPAKPSSTTGQATQRGNYGWIRAMTGIVEELDDPAKHELATLARDGYALAPPATDTKSITYENSNIDLSPDERRAYVSARGKYIADTMSRLQSLPAYQNATNSQKADYWRGVISDSADKGTKAVYDMVGRDEWNRRVRLGRETVGRPTPVQ